MCGISGFKSFGGERPTLDEIVSLFSEASVRGKDASGVAFLRSGELVVYKEPVPSYELVKKQEFKELFDSSIPSTMIMHTRAKTKGAETDNKNNHPIFNKEGIAVVHNGCISNDDYLFELYGYPRDGQVDSEIIMRIVAEKWWEGLDKLNDLGGSFACAAINANKPDELVLFRHSNPISIYMDKERDILFFASTENIIDAGLCQHHRGFRCSDINAYEISDNLRLLINGDGLADKKKLDTKPLFKPYNYGGYDSQWNGTVRTWDRDKKCWRDADGKEIEDSYSKKNNKGKHKSHSASHNCSVKCFAKISSIKNPLAKPIECWHDYEFECECGIKTKETIILEDVKMCHICHRKLVEEAKKESSNKVNCPFCKLPLTLMEFHNGYCNSCHRNISSSAFIGMME